MAAAGSAAPLRLRAGEPSDHRAILDLWDGAIAWLVARGQTGQWGTEPASSRPRVREMVTGWLAAGGVTLVERGGAPVGVSVLGSAPPGHVATVAAPEGYIHFLLSSRAHAGQGIGSALVRRAADDARAGGRELLRVDCWAGAPTLVAWYERQGFRRSDTFLVGDWRGQVFEMAL